MDVNLSKVAIIGAGSVGATLAYNLALKGAVTEIALIDSNREKAEAEILDIKQGASLGRPVKIEATDYDACRTAGSPSSRRAPANAPGSPVWTSWSATWGS